MTLYETALVTGAGRGIGAETVRRFSEMGMQVHAVARSKDELDTLATETGCIPHAVDITDAQAVESALKDIPVDVLVNNAGAAGPDGPIHETDPAILRRILDVNVEAVATLLRVVLPGMRERDRGHIVNVTSIAALHPLPGQIAYSASKMALRAMTQNLRIELFGKRVRVTEIAPARVEGVITLETEIAQAMVYGDKRPNLVAVVVPSDEFIAEWSKANGVDADLASLSENADFAKAIGDVMDRVNARLSQIEKVRRVTIATEAFTTDNAMMTPTLKVRRHKVREAYWERLDALYGRG